MTARVQVQVAVARPPTPANTRTVFVLVDAVTTTEANLIACQIAACDRRVEMVTGSRVIGWTD